MFCSCIPYLIIQYIPIYILHAHNIWHFKICFVFINYLWRTLEHFVKIKHYYGGLWSLKLFCDLGAWLNVFGLKSVAAMNVDFLFTAWWAWVFHKIFLWMKWGYRYFLLCILHFLSLSDFLQSLLIFPRGSFFLQQNFLMSLKYW